MYGVRVRVAALVVVLAAAAAQDYTQPGPCSIKSHTFKKVPVSENQTVPVYVTLPKATHHGMDDDNSYPVIFFLNGFECTACLYTPIAERLASWCYAVVQYDGPIAKFSTAPFVNDATEVKWIPALQLWLDQENKLPSSSLYNQLNLELVGMAGHSRGGKLAALQFGTNAGIRAAYLLDPDDSTYCSTPSYTRASPEYPNAGQLLAGKRIGISAAGLPGACDSDCNGQYAYEFLGNASSGVVYSIAEAGHFSFTAPLTWQIWKCPQGQIVKLFGIPLCNGKEKTLGGIDTLALTTPTMVAWFQADLRGIDAVPDSFQRWLDKQQDAKALSVIRKTEPRSVVSERTII